MEFNFKQNQQITIERVKEIILITIKDAFQEILGETSTMVVWHYLLLNTGLRIEDILDRPEIFISFIRNLFKDGAKIIEKKIKEKLCYRFKINPENIENIDLIDIIKQIITKY